MKVSMYAIKLTVPSKAIKMLVLLHKNNLRLNIAKTARFAYKYKYKHLKCQMRTEQRDDKTVFETELKKQNGLGLTQMHQIM